MKLVCNVDKQHWITVRPIGFVVKYILVTICLGHEETQLGLAHAGESQHFFR